MGTEVTTFLLLASLAFGQEPMEFEPVPADITDAHGTLLQGILVDEKTYAELGRLRAEVKRLEADVQSYEEWKAERGQLFTVTIDALKAEHEAGQQRLVDHYELALTKAKKKDALQRHGFTFGVAVGVVATTALTIGVLNVYDGTLPDGITGN
jgi:hypothetical protein